MDTGDGLAPIECGSLLNDLSGGELSLLDAPLELMVRDYTLTALKVPNSAQ